MSAIRIRRDRCPGVLRPWLADDGLLIRLRLVGGRVTTTALSQLLQVSEEYGDGSVHLTSRANLQVRGLPGNQSGLLPEVVTALEGTGLLPTRGHELVRNIMVSPLTGWSGGRADLRALSSELDRGICAEPSLAALPGRFLFVLDDGRGDLVEKTCDLGLVALDNTRAQLRVGDGWGPVVPLAQAPRELIELAGAFLETRGELVTAPWHVSELEQPLLAEQPPEPALPEAQGPLRFGSVAGGVHVAVPDGLLDRALFSRIAGAATDVVVTPWRGLLVSDPTYTGEQEAADV